MINFSPFFPASEELVTSFSGPGFAAHTIPEPQKRETEMMRKIKIDLFNSDFILPSQL
jgi:hypothetical protein